MKTIFNTGDIKTFTKTVSEKDMAQFESGIVHQVYSTFAIARDAEWSGRLFVLDMLEDGEQGIGTSINIEHKAPAFMGEEVLFIASFIEITNNKEIMTQFNAYVGERLVAQGTQGQKILPQVVIDKIFEKHQKLI